MSTRWVGKRTKALRGRLHTQRELADRAGVSLDLVRAPSLRCAGLLPVRCDL